MDYNGNCGKRDIIREVYIGEAKGGRRQRWVRRSDWLAPWSLMMRQRDLKKRRLKL